MSESPRPAGIWKERYRLPDGSTPVVAVDEEGHLRAMYFMREEEDASEVRRLLEELTGIANRPNLEVLS